MFINSYFPTVIWSEEKPEFVKSLNKASNKYISDARKREKEFKPKRNSFILFSSFLIHKTLRNITDIDKYAISFNLNFHKGG